MFETLKIYNHKEISLSYTLSKLAQLGYKRQISVTECGDFSVKGDILEVYPVNFNFPVRIEWQFDIVDKIYSFDRTLNKKIIDYEFLILIPYIKKVKKFSEDFPLDAILKIKKVIMLFTLIME